MASNGVALYKPPYVSRHHLYGTINPHLQQLIPGSRPSAKLRTSNQNPAWLATDAVAAVVADMRKSKPDLCASVLPDFNLRQIFVPDMIDGVDQYFLRLVATQIAVHNLTNVNYSLATELIGAKDLISRQQEVIAHQHTTISHQGLSAPSGGDNIHVAGEKWGYGHAETARPVLQYDPGPKQPVVSTAEEYKHEDAGQKAAVVLPVTAGGTK